MAILAAAVALGLAATPAQAQDGRVVEVILHDNPFHITPERITASPGEAVTFTVRNAGVIGHDFRICRAEGEGGCGSPVVFVPLLDPGQWGNVTATMPSAGTYRFECSVPGHADAGMTGELIVGSGKGTPAPAIGYALVALGLGVLGRRWSA